jgi:hypothetical protein
MTVSWSARFLLSGVAAAAVTLAGCSWFEDVGEPRSEVVSDPATRQGWKTIEHEGVRVDIPAAWERTDMDDCEFRFEHWAPPDSSACGFDGGVAFYASAVFDPAHGLGIRRADTTAADASTWGGYAYAGDFAVYASDDDRKLVEEVLDSARTTR